MAGIVYLLSNAAMPGLVKIGMTGGEQQVRMDQLYTTGVPLPFECVIAKRVEDPASLEQALHIAFGPNRINPRREFFQINADQALAIIRAFPGEIVTDTALTQPDTTQDERNAVERANRRRRPNLNWREMGIPPGSTIRFSETDETAEVIDDRRIRYRGEDMYLTRATQLALALEYQVHPTPYWSFNGASIEEIYERTYGTRDE